MKYVRLESFGVPTKAEAMTLELTRRGCGVIDTRISGQPTTGDLWQKSIRSAIRAGGWTPDELQTWRVQLYEATKLDNRLASKAFQWLLAKLS